MSCFSSKKKKKIHHQKTPHKWLMIKPGRFQILLPRVLVGAWVILLEQYQDVHIISISFCVPGLSSHRTVEFPFSVMGEGTSQYIEV